MGFLPFFSLETWTLLITCFCLFVTYGYWSYGVFEKLGIPGPKPVMYWGTFGRLNKVYYLADVACAQKYGRVWGLYEFRTPVMAVMDPDMLKTILVKECFTYFTNRRNLPLSGDLSDGVSLAENDQWRRIRNTLSPFFSSGHIKEMFGIMKHHSKKLTLSLRSKVQDGDTVTMKDFFGPYSVDVMGSCAFSVDMDSINNPTGPLITHASNLFNISKLLVIAIGCFPFVLPLLDLLGVSIFPKSSTAYFKTLLEKVKGERNDVLNQKLGDFLQHMMNYQSTKMHEPMNEKQRNGLTEHEILSQATLFVFAGYETSASALVFLAYNLATNPEVMQRLLREIDSTFPNKAPVQYEALMKMEYLDSVVKESLRLYPSATRLERTARETVKINGITIPKEMMVMIPVFALHRDPELWPEPEAFKPDRFSKENKQNINPYTYLPFGAGPRNCLGMRFALVVVKLALVEVLQNFVFSVCEETEIPLQMAATTFISTARPIKLKLVTRSNVSENGEKKNEE